jgi:hypothetical protein
LLLPTQSVAFTTIGGNLNLGLRDFRVFNNFTDATANDNQTPDPNFPGYLGAPVAIWKAYLEWGSRLHGDGNGDPTQPAGLGSGGANFDPTWQGLATTVGGPNDNIVSEISGSSGNTLAFTEGPIGDGWRMRFFQAAAAWQDGPGTFGPGPGFQNFDIQGVGCHEFGHALGLGHTTDQGATMEAAVASPATASRSIAPDDIDGVRFIYGVASATKPIISGVSVGSCGGITISGSNFFVGSQNEVWFTKTGTGGTGVPIKLLNQSSNGAQIIVSAPAEAGPGDLLVKVPGTAH